LVKGISEYTNVKRKSQHNHTDLIRVRVRTSFITEECAVPDDTSSFGHKQ